MKNRLEMIMSGLDLLAEAAETVSCISRGSQVEDEISQTQEEALVLSRETATKAKT